jgi:hypothetical protein
MRLHWPIKYIAAQFGDGNGKKQHNQSAKHEA